LTSCVTNYHRNVLILYLIAYYSLSKNESLSSKLGKVNEEWDYTVSPQKPKDKFTSITVVAVLAVAGALFKKGTDLTNYLPSSSKSTYLDARVIRQPYTYNEIQSSLRKLTPEAINSLPDVSPEVFSSLSASVKDTSVFSSEALESDKVNVLVYWRPTNLASVRTLSILTSLSKVNDEINIIPVLSPKFPSEARFTGVASPILLDVLAPAVVLLDKDLSSWRKLGVNEWPTVAVLSKGGKKVLLALQGERAISPVLGNAVLAANPRDTRRSLAFFTTTPLPRSTGSVAVIKSLNRPSRLAVDAQQGLFYISDTGNHRVLELSAEGKVLRCFGSASGVSGPASPGSTLEDLRFNQPMGIAIDTIGRIMYVADFGNNALRRISLKDGSAVTVTADDVDKDSDNVPYDFPELKEIESELGKKLKAFGSMTAEEVQRALVRRKLQNSPLARQIIGRTRSMQGPTDVVKSDAIVYASAAMSRQVWRVESGGFTMRPALGSGLAGRRDVIEADEVNPLLSDGLRFAQPMGLVSLGPKLLVVDSDACSIRLVDMVNDVSCTLVGGDKNNPSGDDDTSVPFNNYGDIDAPGYKGRLQFPSAACPFQGGSVLITDTLNNKVKKLVITNSEIFGLRVEVSTVLSSGLSAPQGIVVDNVLNKVLISDTGNNRIVISDINFQKMSELKIDYESI
jgi:DNA-binding beta-propeller fold protein YncE